MSKPSESGAPIDRNIQTRRAILAGGALGAGAIGASLLSPSGSEAQVLPLDDRYVWRDRMPINVKDRGAKGDGTTDDTTAIQSAITSVAAAGGGGIYFPPGDYVVNGGLTIPPEKPMRLAGAGMDLVGNGGPVGRPTRLVRQTGTTTLLSAIGTSGNRVRLELCDMEIRGSGTAGMLVDIQAGNCVQLHNIRFVGAVATGLRMRNIFNSSGSHLRFLACGNGSGSPACLFDGADGGGQAGCDTVQWDNLQFEGNGGTDLKLTGNATNDPGTPANVIQMSQIKMEGGNSGSANCPYIDLDYTQGCIFSNVYIGVHGGRTVTPLRKAPPYTGTRADKFVNLQIDKVGSGSFPYGIEHSKGSLQLENVTILGASTAAIKVNSTVAAGEFQLGNLITNVARAVIDSRTAVPSVASAATITPPRERYVSVTGTSSITEVRPHEHGYVMTLAFPGALTVTDGVNLRLAGDFVTSGNDTLTLVSDGTNWYEVGRSVN